MQPIEHYNIPIFNYLKKYSNQAPNIFHMPGHKLAKGIPQELAQDVLKLDVTEFEGTDNLHHAEGIIKEAQQLASQAFGADESFFLVNGSTCGVQAAIMSVCRPGESIIIGRDAHKSVVGGLILSGARPVFVYPETNHEYGISAEISSASIEKVLLENPDAKAVLITRPNYYGICSDIEEISSIVHRQNKILIVDEAHGAHLTFSTLLPNSSLQYGADICIQSAHKTLPAITQGAYLHVKGNRIDREKLNFNLAMLQTSSPSYIIMAYLDIAREIMQTEGPKRIKYLLENIQDFVIKTKKETSFKILSSRSLNDNSEDKGARISEDKEVRISEDKEVRISEDKEVRISEDKEARISKDKGARILHDSTRLVINTNSIGITGYTAEQMLRKYYNTQIEMADHQNIVLISTIADDVVSFSRLGNALKGLEEISKRSGNNIISVMIENVALIAETYMTPQEAYQGDKETIRLQDANGRICAGVITPYPPGIPVIYPGEIMNQEIIEYLRNIQSLGGHVNGTINDSFIQVITSRTKCPTLL